MHAIRRLGAAMLAAYAMSFMSDPALAERAQLVSSANIFTPVGPGWTVRAIGDVDGDGTDDIIWQTTGGQVAYWKMGGGQRISGHDIGTPVEAWWHLRAAGDVNGDGTDDIIWKSDGGQVLVWIMANGQRASFHDVWQPQDAAWSVVSAGDVNGDGTADIIWRHSNGQAHFWTMSAGQRTGGYHIDGPTPVGAEWHLRGAGDVDGDRTDDIVWRHDSGQAHIWTMVGGQRTDGYNVHVPTGPEWDLKGAGDMDGDGVDDLVWQHSNGQVHYWRLGAGTRRRVRITEVFCEETTDSGEDEVYLTVDMDGVGKRLPADGYQSMNEDSSISLWYANAEYSGSTVTVNLMEDDDGSNDDDLIGTLTISSATPSGPGSQTLTGADGKYTVKYVVEDDVPTTTFTMAVMSDPQFYYCEHKACARHSSDYRGGKVDKDTLSDSENEKANIKTNEWHSKSLKALAGSAGNFRGVIVNGDLTNVMQDDQLDNFRKYYEHEFTVYPGLGNHDYANYTPYKNDSISCSGVGIAVAKHYCLKEMVDYLSERVRSLGTVKAFDYTATKWNRSGSYAYYWDIGTYRFIQLNFLPAYAMNFDVYMSDRVGTENYQITSAMTWLQNVLNQADSKNKSVILNMHALNTQDGFFTVEDDPTTTRDGATIDNRYKAQYAQFQAMLGANLNVRAIFAGHIHHWIGDVEVTDHSNAGERATALASPARNHYAAIAATGSASRNVPIYFGGSAMYNMYLRVDFAPNGMTIRKIDSENGGVIAFGRDVTISW